MQPRAADHRLVLAREIVSIKQFCKYLATKTHLLEHNAADELETPKLPKRMPKYLSLHESIRVLLESEKSPRDYCILTIFLNCALRLSELVSLDVDQVTEDTIRVIGKGNKERSIYQTPATKKALTAWLEDRKKKNPQCNALFITKSGTRVTTRCVQDVVNKCLKKVGLAERGLSTHKLRHTAATTMFRYGHVDIRTLQTILGHENINTTTIYTSVSAEQIQSAVNSNPLASMFGK